MLNRLFSYDNKKRVNMLNFLIDGILYMGIYIYLIPIYLGFFIFYQSYIFNNKAYKYFSLLGLFFVFLFIFVEYYSKTNIHFVTDIIGSLKTGHIKFSKETFLPLLLITFFVSGLFWIPTLVAISASFIFALASPKMYIDFGFLIFILGAMIQTIHLIRNEKENSYYYRSTFSYEEYGTIILTLLAFVVKVLKIIT